MEALSTFQKIQAELDHADFNDLVLLNESQGHSAEAKVSQIIDRHIASLDEATKVRLRNEYYDCGPLNELLSNESLTEIIVNAPDKIWFEKGGELFCHEDSFFSEATYRNTIERILKETNKSLTQDHPSLDSQFRGFRLCLLGPEIAGGHYALALRRHPLNPWTLEKLATGGWATEAETQILLGVLNDRQNLLIIGGTGSGKTSLMNALLQKCPTNQRIVIIEDSAELHAPNGASLKLLTREDPNKTMMEVDQSYLVKKSLRLRPDRIVMGEIRGSEAKDFLMALATGHEGSFGTLHASHPGQALIRLEMLIQMGAPQWGLTAIRRLISMSLHYIISVQRNSEGRRQLKGIYRLASLEDTGFTLETIFERD